MNPQQLRCELNKQEISLNLRSHLALRLQDCPTGWLEPPTQRGQAGQGKNTSATARESRCEIDNTAGCLDGISLTRD